MTLTLLKKFSLPLLLTILFTGCQKETLWVQNSYIDYKDLASYYVRSPDPRKKCPDIGQKLIVFWNLPPTHLQADDLRLLLKMRYKNREEQSISVPIDKKKGHFIYTLLNDKYYEKDGILTYKAEIFKDSILSENWEHQIWTDVLTIESDE